MPEWAELAGANQVPPYDIRLRRESTYRQLAVAIARKVLRVSSLHLVDGALITLLAIALTRWAPFAPLERFIPAVVAILLLSLNAFSVYEAGDGRRDARRLLLAVVLASSTFGVLALFPPQLPLDPLLLVIFGGLAFFALVAGREVVDQVVRHAYKRGIGLRRALLIGSLDEVSRALEGLREGENIDHYIVGHVTAAREPDPTSLGTLATLGETIDRERVQEVIISTTLAPDALEKVADCCFQGGAALFMIPPMPRTSEYRAESLRVGSQTLLRLHPGHMELPGLLVKRAFDLLISTIALVLLSPLMALVALAIKIDSRGPVFFRQERVGVGGKLFTIWKFRSMTADSEARQAELAGLNHYGDARLFKIIEDPRITRVGRFLRRSSLDELPQLFNVLAGEMSLVGPRPPLPSEVQSYQPHHFERLSVVPGITGPWQVNGRNLVTDFEKVVRMERAYIRSWSLLLDAKILVRTVRVVITGEGAY